MTPSATPAGAAGPRAELVGAEAQRGEHQPERQSDHNVIQFGPVPVGWLPLPLTQARAAAIVHFQARTGRDLIIPHLLDALDDIVFDLGPDRQPGATDCRPGERPAGEAERREFVSRGASCTEHTNSEPERPAKSNARSCRAMHDCAVLPSDEPAKDSGLTKPLRSSPPAQNAACELQPTNYPATANLLADLSRRSLPLLANGLCGNED
jgi:hypothetical protein